VPFALDRNHHLLVIILELIFLYGANYNYTGTTISPWIVTLEALEPFACEAPKQVTGFFLLRLTL